MAELTEADVFGVIGESGFARLVAAFYRRVPDDEILGPMYPADDLRGAEDRLRGFLIYRLGGPPTYIEERGHPALRMRHAPYELTPTARDHWLALMDQALQEVELPAEVEQVLRPFLAQTATFLINRPA